MDVTQIVCFALFCLIALVLFPVYLVFISKAWQLGKMNALAQHFNAEKERKEEQHG